MRCFVAVELSEEIKGRLVELQRRCALLDRSVRWTGPEQMHLTLKFLGEVSDADIASVAETMSSVAARQSPITFLVRGVGCFPPGGAVRIFWVGVEESSGTLARLQAYCEESFARLGFARERRSYTPHLTIGRIKDASHSLHIRDVARRELSFEAGRQRVDELVLFQSVLSDAGAMYVPLARAALGPKPAGARTL